MRKFLDKTGLDNKYLILILLIGLLARLLFICLVPNELQSDFKTYYETSVNIANGVNDVNTSYQGPGYTLLIGYMFKIFNTTDVNLVKYMNVVISSLTIMLVYHFVGKLTSKKLVVYGSTLFTALLPNYIAYNNVVGTETISAFMLVLILNVYLLSINKIYKYLLLGLLIGYIATIKPYFLAYPAVLFICDWIRDKSIMKILKNGLIMLVGMLVVILPLTISNFLKYDKLIPVSYNGGYVLYLNNNDNNHTGMYMPVADVQAGPEFLEEVEKTGATYGSMDYRSEHLYRNAAIKWIVNNPLEFTKLGILRLKNTFFSSSSDVFTWTMEDMNDEYWTWDISKKRVYQLSLSGSLLIYYLLSISGLIITLVGFKKTVVSIFKPYKADLLYLIPIVNTIFFTTIYFVFEGQGRYSYPILFLFIICFFIILERFRGTEET